MARENYVHLYGTVNGYPEIMYSASGNAVAMIYINVVRSKRPTGDGKEYAMTGAMPLIMTQDPDMIKKIEVLEDKSTVILAGVISCIPLTKTVNCTKCGAEYSKEITMVYIYPWYLEKCGQLSSQEEVISFLSEKRPISNICKVSGTVVTKPKKIKTKEGLYVVQYQLALNRKYKIPLDDESADYPWVKTYGDNARSDYKRLYIGSKVSIDGCIQTRRVTVEKKCPSCGESFKWRNMATEMVPYSTEYDSNYLTDKDLEEKENRKKEDYLANIFGSE